MKDGTMDKIAHYPTGRCINHDDESWNYPARRATQRVTRLWKLYGQPLNQLETSSCTGHAAAHAMNTRPFYRLFTKTRTHDDAMGFYAAATAVDPFPWTFPPTDNGSSGLAVAKVLKGLGLISSYGWAFGLDHALDALTLGPVLFGTEWREGMYEPDQTGLVRAVGDSVGGHEYCGIGVNVERRTVTCVQSWGPTWGRRGFFDMTWDDLGDLLDKNGDVVVLNR